MHRLLLLLVFCAPVAAFGAAIGTRQNDLAAILTHESHEVTAEGVTRDFRYQERFIRHGGHVWAERVLPEGVRARPEAKHKGHDHEFNFTLAAKHVSRDAKGVLTVSFADTREKVVVAISPEEYQSVGFDGSWESAYYLVSPALVRKLAPIKAAGPAANARWYERKGKDDFFRVLWAEDLDLPLVIESGARDGSRHTRVSAKIVSLPAGLPWMNLQNFELKDYDDLLD